MCSICYNKASFLIFHFFVSKLIPYSFISSPVYIRYHQVQRSHHRHQVAGFTSPGNGIQHDNWKTRADRNLMVRCCATFNSLQYIIPVRPGGFHACIEFTLGQFQHGFVLALKSPSGILSISCSMMLIDCSVPGYAPYNRAKRIAACFQHLVKL